MTDLLMVTAAALSPALCLAWYFYHKAKYRNHPFSVAVRAFLLGMAAAVLAGLVESPFHLLSEPGWQRLLLVAVLAPVVEETCKCFLAYRYLFRRFALTDPFDGILYSVLVALGFASLENIYYVIDAYATDTLAAVAGKRALLSVPAHALFSTIWGARLGAAAVRKEFKPNLILPRTRACHHLSRCFQRPCLFSLSATGTRGSPSSRFLCLALG